MMVALFMISPPPQEDQTKGVVGHEIAPQTLLARGIAPLNPAKHIGARQMAPLCRRVLPGEHSLYRSLA